MSQEEQELTFNSEEANSPCPQKSPCHEMLTEDGFLKTIDLAIAEFNVEYGVDIMERWASYNYGGDSCRQPTEMELRDFMVLFPSIKEKIINPWSILDDINIDDVLAEDEFTSKFVTPITPVNLNTHEEDALGIAGVDADVSIF